MRLTLYLSGWEFLVNLTRDQQPPEPANEVVHGPPFGFTGGSHAQVEHAYQDDRTIVTKHREPGRP